MSFSVCIWLWDEVAQVQNHVLQLASSSLLSASDLTILPVSVFLPVKWGQSAHTINICNIHTFKVWVRCTPVEEENKFVFCLPHTHNGMPAHIHANSHKVNKMSFNFFSFFSLRFGALNFRPSLEVPLLGHKVGLFVFSQASFQNILPHGSQIYSYPSRRSYFPLENWSLAQRKDIPLT